MLLVASRLICLFFGKEREVDCQDSCLMNIPQGDGTEGNECHCTDPYMLKEWRQEGTMRKGKSSELWLND